jgi:glucokinase
MDMRILCLESGGTKLVAAVSNSKGEILEKKVHLRREGQRAGETLKDLVNLGKQLGLNRQFTAVGFGFGGTVRRSTGDPLTCFHEDGWEEVDSSSFLKKSFGIPVFIENDCNLAALAEARVGYQIFDGTVFYITVGTGIGGGIVHNGSLLTTGEFGEGEIGHIIVDPDGPECPCGKRGCLETLCSGPGLEELSKPFNKGLSLDSRQIMNGFKKNQQVETKIATEAADLISNALAPVINILSPQYIVFGGGVMRKNSEFLNLIQEKTLEKIFPVFLHQPPKFLLSRLEESVVCQGAAIYALQRLNELEHKRSI